MIQTLESLFNHDPSHRRDGIPVPKSPPDGEGKDDGMVDESSEGDG